MSNEQKLKTNIRLMLITTFAIAAAMALNGALYNNFLKFILNNDYIKMGQVESIREFPGILSAFINGIAGSLPEPILAAISLFVMGIGLAGYHWTTDITSLIGMSFFWSVGFHLWAPLSGAIGMSLATDNKKGAILGRIASIGAIGTLSGYFIIAVLAHIFKSRINEFYRWMYFAAGLAAILGGISIYRLKEIHGTPKRLKIIFRKKYGIYYILQFLEGCRKQFFITFAAFTLVINYKSGPEIMAILLFINYTIASLVSPVFGRWIDHYGEKRILSINYILLIIVFLLYAVIHNRYFLYVLFCLDNILFTFSIALTTYLGKIAPKEEITASLAIGVSVNHIAAVIVPIVGFVVWKHLGYEICFIFGAFVVALQLYTLKFMHIHVKNHL